MRTSDRVRARPGSGQRAGGAPSGARAIGTPNFVTPDGVLAMQQTAGNEAVQRVLVQREPSLPNPLIGLRRKDGFGTPKTDPTRARVKKLQGKVNSKQGMSLGVDGAFGDKTLKGVQSFMTDIGKSDEEVVAVGEAGVDEETADALMDRQKPPVKPPDAAVEAKLEVIGERYNFMIDRQRDALNTVARDILQGKAAEEESDIGLDLLKALLKAGFGGVYGLAGEFLKEQLDKIVFSDVLNGVKAKESAKSAVDKLEDPAIEKVMGLIVPEQKEDETPGDVADFFDAHLETVSQAGLELKERFATKVKPDLRELDLATIEQFAEKVNMTAHKAFKLQRDEALTQWAVSRAHKSKLGTKTDPRFADPTKKVTSFDKALRTGDEQFGGVLTVHIASTNDPDQEDLGPPDQVLLSNLVIGKASLPGMGPRAMKAFELKEFGSLKIPMIFRGVAPAAGFLSRSQSVAFGRDESGNISVIGANLAATGAGATAYFTEVAKSKGMTTAQEGAAAIFSNLLTDAKLLKGALAPNKDEDE